MLLHDTSHIIQVLSALWERYHHWLIWIGVFICGSIINGCIIGFVLFSEWDAPYEAKLFIAIAVLLAVVWMASQVWKE